MSESKMLLGILKSLKRLFIWNTLMWKDYILFSITHFTCLFLKIFHIHKKYGGKWTLLNLGITTDIFFFILFSKSAVSSYYSYNQKKNVEEEKVLIRGFFSKT